MYPFIFIFKINKLSFGCFKFLVIIGNYWEGGRLHIGKLKKNPFLFVGFSETCGENKLDFFCCEISRHPIYILQIDI